MSYYIKKPIEQLLQDKEVKTSFTDINKFVSGVVNGVDAKAGGCNPELKQEWHWWGIRTTLNNCAVNNLKAYLNNQITLLTVLGFIGCSIACGGIVLVYQWYAGQIDWANNNCGSEGVVIDTWWPQVTVVKNIC